MFRRIHLLLVILLPAILPAQAVFLGMNAGAGLSKLEPKPTSSFTGFERAPAYLLGATLEYVTLKSVISGKLGFWFEWGGEDDNPVALMTIPLLVKASVGKKWKPYLEGGLAGCYVYERSRRYQTGDFAGIYGAGLEHILPSGSRIYLEYLHLAGITSVFNERMTGSNGTEVLIENFHIRQHLQAGVMFFMGAKRHYIKQKLKRE